MPEDPPARLDLAIDWLQRSLEDLTELQRRTAPPASTPSVAQGQPGSISSTPAVPPVPTADVPPPAKAAMPSPASASPTPLLDKLGRDLAALAREGKLSPIVGRGEELDWMVEILVRSTKRNPVLLGPAGSGKTAIVEGLAQRIAAGKVPAMLRDARIIEVPLASLVAGTQYRGQLEERLADLVKEASQPGIILFFDEIHLLAGAGGSEGGISADEVLKPALSRGDIAVIGATTSEEYRATIAKDAALARRFTTVAVRELDRAGTLPILKSIRASLQRSRGIAVSDGALEVLLAFADSHIANRRFPDKAIDLLEQAVAAAVVAGRKRVDRADAVRATETWSARASATPTLDRFGRDLVQMATEGRLGPIVGREREIDAMVQVLLRHSKRNPLLLGPAGSGKTAVVEGFAIRLAGSGAPPRLAGVHVFDIAILPLAAACAREPELLGEFLLEARHPSVIVFFDEVHLLMSPAVRDFAESLKPALSRGEIACIGATTGEEYQASIETDAALDRRFTQIPIERMSAEAVRRVLLAVRDSLGRKGGISIDDAAVDELIGLADELLPNRSFPDKGVDLLESAVSYALARSIAHVDVAVARQAAAAVAGLSLDPGPQLAELRHRLAEAGILPVEAATELLRRLGVSLRGIDADRARPQAVVLLSGAAAAAGPFLASIVAETVFQNAASRIGIDLTSLTEDQSISTLLGSAPGLVGSERPLPLDELRRNPRAVVLFNGIDRCAPSIRQAIAAGLRAGSLTDAMGRAMPLGSAVVILTAADAVAADAASGPAFEPEVLAVVDVIAAEAGATPTGRSADWLRNRLLDPFAERLARGGWQVAFDQSFVDWLAKGVAATSASPEAYLDRVVAPQVVEALDGHAGPARLAVVDDRVVVRRYHPDR